MAFNPNNPQEVQAYRQSALQAGGSPEQVDAYIAQKQAQVAQQQPSSNGQSLPAKPSEAMSVGGFIQNAIRNVGDMVRPFNVGQNIQDAKTAMQGGDESYKKYLSEHQAPNFGSMVMGMGKGMAETAGVNFTDGNGKPTLGWSPGNIIKHAYEKPVDTVANLLMAKEIGGALKPAGAVEEAVTAGETPKTGRLESMGKNLRQDVVNPQVKASPYASAIEDQISQNLQDVGIKGNAGEQYSQLGPKMKELRTQIEAKLAESTKLEPVKPLVDSLEKNMQETTNFDDTIQGYKKWNDHFVNQAKQAANEDGLVSGKSFYDLKHKIAEQIPKAFEKEANPNAPALTPKEEMGLAAWHYIDDLITQIDPSVKDLTTKQSLLYKASPGLKASRDAAGTMNAEILGTKIPVPGGLAQTVEDATGRAMISTGKNLGNIKTALKKPFTSSTPLSLSALTSTEQKSADNSNNSQDYNESEHTLPSDPSSIQLGQTGSGDSIPQGNGSMQESPDQAPKTLNSFGATPQQIYEAYIKTATSGNKRKANILRQMYVDEVAFQKTQGKANHPTYSEFDKKMIFAGDEVRTALDYFKKNKDKIPVGPLSGSDLGKSIGRIGGSQTKEATNFYSELSLARTAVQSALLGANKSPQEIKDFLDANFSSSLPANVLENNMQAFIGSMDRYRNTLAGPEGSQVLPSTPVDANFSE